MGELSERARLPTAAVEFPLPWGPVMRGVRTGDGADVALLLHEPGADLDAWGAFPERLARALPVTVVTLDLPGHGLSDDPWEPERLLEIVRLVMGGIAREEASGDGPRPSGFPHPNRNYPHPNPSPIATGEGLLGPGDFVPSESTFLSLQEANEEPGAPPRFRFLVAAGATATCGLQLAAEVAVNGVVCLSPVAMAGDGKPERSPRVAKLIVAGALAGSDLQTARRFAGQCGGWAVVMSLPVAARGTALFAWERAAQLEEAIVAFLRDSRRRRTLTRMPFPLG